MKSYVAGFIASLLMAGACMAQGSWTTSRTAWRWQIDGQGGLVAETGANMPVVPPYVAFTPSEPEFRGDLSGIGAIRMTIQVKDVLPQTIRVDMFRGNDQWQATGFAQNLPPNSTTTVTIPLVASEWTTPNASATFADSVANVSAIEIHIAAHDNTSPPYQYVRISDFVLLDRKGSVLTGPGSLTPVQRALKERFGTESVAEFYSHFFAARIVSVDPGAVTITWPGIAGKTYRVYRTDDLKKGRAGFKPVGTLVAEGASAVVDVVFTDRDESLEVGKQYSYRVHQID